MKVLGVLEDGVFRTLTEAEVSEEREIGEALNLRVRIMRHDLDYATDPTAIIDAVLGKARHDLHKEWDRLRALLSSEPTLDSGWTDDDPGSEPTEGKG